MKAPMSNIADAIQIFHEDPAQLRNQELLSLDFSLHEDWKQSDREGEVQVGDTAFSQEDLAELHIPVQQEMAKREFAHFFWDGLDEASEILKGIRQPFGSYGGKRFLAHKIASLLPYHKTYVEPLARR